jgi:hypothetical protein
VGSPLEIHVPKLATPFLWADILARDCTSACRFLSTVGVTAERFYCCYPFYGKEIHTDTKLWFQGSNFVMIPPHPPVCVYVCMWGCAWIWYHQFAIGYGPKCLDDFKCDVDLRMSVWVSGVIPYVVYGMCTCMFMCMAHGCVTVILFHSTPTVYHSSVAIVYVYPNSMKLKCSQCVHACIIICASSCWAPWVRGTSDDPLPHVSLDIVFFPPSQCCIRYVAASRHESQTGV